MARLVKDGMMFTQAYACSVSSPMSARIELAVQLGEYLRSVDAQRPLYKTTGRPAPWPDESIFIEVF